MSQQDILEMVQAAEENLRASHVLLDGHFYGLAAGRAYYCMFHLAAALLTTKGLAFSHHSSVIAAFGLHFAKQGPLPQHLHRYLMDGFAVRQSGEYEYNEVPPDRAEITIIRAEEFLAAAKAYLASNPGHP